MKSKKQQKYSTKIRAIIIQEIENAELNGQMISEALEISRMHLHRKIKVEKGISISHYILAVRLEKAQELLTETKQLITTIAYSLGFKDTSYFTRVFKKNLNCTPSQFRLMWSINKVDSSIPRGTLSNTEAFSLQRERQSG